MTMVVIISKAGQEDRNSPGWGQESGFHLLALRKMEAEEGLWEEREEELTTGSRGSHRSSRVLSLL